MDEGEGEEEDGKVRTPIDRLNHSDGPRHRQLVMMTIDGVVNEEE